MTMRLMDTFEKSFQKALAVTRPGNAKRITKAKIALKPFAEFDLRTIDDMHTAMVDLIANLMHAAHEKGIDFDRVVQGAKNHFNAEK